MTDAPTVEEIKKLFERLATAPRLLFEVCSGASSTRLARPVAPGKWSPLQIIRHLIGVDREAFLPRIEKMLAEDNPFLPAWDQDAWMKQYGDVRDTKAVTLIDEYARLREKIAVMIFDLSPEEWLRTGEHEERGPITIYSLCAYFADHDEHHRRQIAAHLAASDSHLYP